MRIGSIVRGFFLTQPCIPYFADFKEPPGERELLSAVHPCSFVVLLFTPHQLSTAGHCTSISYNPLKSLENETFRARNNIAIIHSFL